MFKRELISKLERWATNKYRKPLVLRGARQVGKTTVVNEFGKSFMDRSPYSVAIRVWSQPFSMDQVHTVAGKEFTLMNVPFYQVGSIPELLSFTI